MKIWDLRTLRCLQRLNSRPTEEDGAGEKSGAPPPASPQANKSGGGGGGKGGGMRSRKGLSSSSSSASDFASAPTTASALASQGSITFEVGKEGSDDRKGIARVVYDRPNNRLVGGLQHLIAWPSIHAKDGDPEVVVTAAGNEASSAPAAADDTTTTQQEDAATATASAAAAAAANAAAAAAAASAATDTGVQGGSSGAALTRIACNTTYNVILTSDVEGTLRMYELSNGRLMRHVPNAHFGSAVTAITFDDRGRRLVTGAHDGSVRVWSLASGCEPLAELRPACKEEVTSLAHITSRNSRHVLATGWARNLQLWRDDDARSSATSMATSAGGPVSNITDLSWASEPEHKDDALCLAFYPPATVVSGGANGDVLVWELDTSALTVQTGGADKDEQSSFGSLRRKFQTPSAGRALNTAIKRAAGDGTPTVASKRAARHSKELSEELDAPPAVEALLFLRTIAPPLAPLIAASADGTLCCWAVVSGTQPVGVELDMHAGHNDDDALCSIATSDDNSLLITADGGGTVKVWKTDPLRKRLQRMMMTPAMAAAAAAAEATGGGGGGGPPGGRRRSVNIKTPPPPPSLGASGRRNSSAQLDLLSQLGESGGGGGAPVGAALVRRGSFGGRRGSNDSGNSKDGFPPPLGSDGLEMKHWWRVRDNGLVGIALIPPDSGHSYLVATAAGDGSANLYTLAGSHIGVFGQASPWDISNQKTYASRAPMSHLTKYERMTIEREKARKRLKSKRSWGTARSIFDEEDAAETMQAGYRGFKSRKEVKEQKAAMEAAEVARQEMEKAAIKADRDSDLGSIDSDLDPEYDPSTRHRKTRLDDDDESDEEEEIGPTKAILPTGFARKTVGLDDRAGGDDALEELRERLSKKKHDEKEGNTLRMSATWSATLNMGAAVRRGSFGTAEEQAAEAAKELHIERTLREAGTTGTWQPATFRSAVRAHLVKRFSGAHGSASRGGPADSDHFLRDGKASLAASTASGGGQWRPRSAPGHTPLKPKRQPFGMDPHAGGPLRDAQLQIERRLEGLLAGGKLAIREAALEGPPSTWDRALTVGEWTDAPDEGRPQRLTELRASLKDLQKKHRKATAEEASATRGRRESVRD